VVTQAMLAKSGASADLDEGLPTYLIDIVGAEIALLFKEHASGAPRVSVRTVHPYDAAALAAHFGGGGHVRAAGLTFAGSLAEAQAAVVASARALLARQAGER
jgi:phosphoesterase RecJ-like protein